MSDPEKHRLRHVELHTTLDELHTTLDELIADWLQHNPKVRMSKDTVLDLMSWSHRQTEAETLDPDE